MTSETASSAHVHTLELDEEPWTSRTAGGNLQPVEWEKLRLPSKTYTPASDCAAHTDADLLSMVATPCFRRSEHDSRTRSAEAPPPNLATLGAGAIALLMVLISVCLDPAGQGSPQHLRQQRTTNKGREHQEHKRCGHNYTLLFTYGPFKKGNHSSMSLSVLRLHTDSEPRQW